MYFKITVEQIRTRFGITRRVLTTDVAAYLFSRIKTTYRYRGLYSPEFSSVIHNFNVSRNKGSKHIASFVSSFGNFQLLVFS